MIQTFATVGVGTLPTIQERLKLVEVMAASPTAGKAKP